MFCGFCGTFMGIMNMSSFCENCAFLRRLYLLHEPTAFLERIKCVFLNVPKQETIIETHQSDEIVAPLAITINDDPQPKPRGKKS
jgi:hypothetical protein